MDIVFWGSGAFAVKSLEAIVSAGHKVILVVTQPDKPQGRHLNYTPTEVKIKARELNLNILQPVNPNSQETAETLRHLSADLFVVISYGHILKGHILKLPKLYPINIHASLLPKYRGAAPINWAIMHGERETGISIIRMSDSMDAGDILLQKKIAVSQEDDSQTMAKKLEELSAKSLIEAVNLIRDGKAKFSGQDERKVSCAPKLEKGHGRIDWNKEALTIHNQIRGLIPWPGAFTYHNGKLLKIWKSVIRDSPQARPGEILMADKNGILVGCAKAALTVTELQVEGKKRLRAEDFLCGHRLSAGDRLG